MSELIVSRKEHEPLPSGCNPKQWNDSYYKNPLLTWSNFGSKEDPPRNYWQTYYRIGAQWLDEKREQALVVTPKIENIDFTEMFLSCLESGLAVTDFSKIYDIDFDQPAVPTNKLDTVLTPLIIIHFLTVVEGIAKRGLKRGYVHREENLKKVKGRIRILANERKNIIPRRFDRVYCQYNEFTVDIPENRLIKKALLFAQRELARLPNFKHYSKLILLENKCLAAFTQVSPEIELRDVKLIKSHKLFREYDLAVKLAKTILRRNDYSLKKASDDKKPTPVFWLDMALLFEHYVYSILHEQERDRIQYQVSGAVGGKPDFLFSDVSRGRYILDTKYMFLYKNNISLDIVNQLSGYSRDVGILKKLGYNDNGERENIVVPCVVLYPRDPEDTSKYNPDQILNENNMRKVEKLTKFYKIGVALPREKQNG
ncbi:MAG: hypothetical protein IJG38_13180 [Thermoguttaceae bacterium]|nr:hypothetical protein [Thermoguttaceae bacterium]